MQFIKTPLERKTKISADTLTAALHMCTKDCLLAETADTHKPGS